MDLLTLGGAVVVRPYEDLCPFHSSVAAFVSIPMLIRPIYMMSILMAPLVVHGLTSYKEGLSLDQLEYRLAKPSDVPLCDRVQPKAGLYVAVEPRGNVGVDGWASP